MTAGPTADYVSQIKRRVQDNVLEREDREKRRRKVLVEQLKAMYQQEVSVVWGGWGGGGGEPLYNDTFTE